MEPPKPRHAEQIQKWLAKAAVTALAFALLRPKSTACAAIGAVALAVAATLAAGRHPDKPPPPNAWRIQQMTDAVREADARVRARMLEQSLNVPGDAAPIEPLSGVFETMRDQASPPHNPPAGPGPSETD